MRAKAETFSSTVPAAEPVVPAPAAVRELAVSPGGDLYCLADHGCLFMYAEAAK